MASTLCVARLTPDELESCWVSEDKLYELIHSDLTSEENYLDLNWSFPGLMTCAMVSFQLPEVKHALFLASEGAHLANPNCPKQEIKDYVVDSQITTLSPDEVRL